MLDNLSLKVEELAQKEGSYKDAVVFIAEKIGYDDFDELLPLLHPLIIQKVRQEFIDKNYIPSLKQKNSLKDFFS